MRSLYQVLDVAATEDIATIKKAYHRIALANHPDKTNHLSAGEREERERKFKEATDAWEVLSDGAKRRDYDSSLMSQPDRSSSKYNPNDKTHQFKKRARSPPKPRCHPFSTAMPAGLMNPDSWYRCPVTEDSVHTTIAYSNSDGWDFSIDILKRFGMRDIPFLPAVTDDTSTSIEITLPLYLAQKYPPRDSGKVLKDVVISMKHTPRKAEIAITSVFEQIRRVKHLKLTFTTSFPDMDIDCKTPLEWQFAFDGPTSFFDPYAAPFGVTQLMFFPGYPEHTIPEWDGDKMWTRDGRWPKGSPMQQLRDAYGEVRFVQLGKMRYCLREEWEGKVFWKVCAMGRK